MKATRRDSLLIRMLAALAVTLMLLPASVTVKADVPSQPYPPPAEGVTVLDSVNIGGARGGGYTQEEIDHELEGWTHTWTCGPYSFNPPGGDWCACHDGGPGVGNMRAIWGESGACPTSENWASEYSSYRAHSIHA